MDNGDQAHRWQGQRSSFTWEQDALEHIKKQMPLTEPYRAWQTITFTANSGHVREVDLFIATLGGLFLIEIKSHSGTATNTGSTWLFRDGNVTRTIENPLHFTDLKAKELRGQLQRAAPKGLHIPFIEVGVFLSDQTLRSHLDEFQTQRVYGRHGLEEQTGLPCIWHDLLSQPPRSDKDRVTPTLSKQLPGLLQKIGIARLHKVGKVGPYELAARSFDNGPSWEDYLATNPALPADQPRRVRVYLSGQQATEDEKKSTQRAARREYLALQGISHDGIVRAEQYSDELITGPAVVFRHGKDWQRLDHFLAAQAEAPTAKDAKQGSSSGLPIDTRIDMIRQVAEALDHAHRRHLYHRALAPRSVYVELDGYYPRLRIADWQVAARPHGPASSTTTSATGTVFGGPNALLKYVEQSAGPYLAPEINEPSGNSAQIDIFGLGALSYLILTGEPPAPNREQLAARLTADRALIPSSTADSISPQMDALVREATQVNQLERTGSVRDFIRQLDHIEEALTDPKDRQPAPDPLKAVKGDVIEGWTVVRVLGNGTTSRALLVTSDGHARRVFKVALNDNAAARLKNEAQQLAPLADSHVARLLDAPFEAGPPGARRWVIGIEYVDRTLHEELRRVGPLAWTINELERFGEDLFQALTFLDRRGVWHRDIKPENIGLRKLPRKGRELVLFDFSLAGTPETELEAGTKGYRDPFLGSATRQRFDQAAELYAVAVTLHEMASGELPTWGDELVPVGFLPADAEVQLAEDVFDQVIRDGLVRFFKQALHRDATQRYGSLRAMSRGWTSIFEGAKTDPPVSTSATIDALEAADDLGDDDEDAARAIAAKLDAVAASATAGTELGAAGLSGYALSVARRHLGVETVGQFAAVPTRRIIRTLGIGRDTRQELIRRSQEWRRNLNLSENDSLYPAGTPISPAERTRQAVPSQPAAGTPDGVAASPADQSTADAATELARLPLDEVARRIAPDSPPALRLVIGLIASPEGRRVSPWASRQDVARELGMSVMEVATSIDRLQARWPKSVPALRSVRNEVVEILREHGRVQGLEQLALALLVRRGSEEADPEQRLIDSAVCVRAAVEAEERLDSPRMRSQRSSLHKQGPHGHSGTGVLVALTGSGEEGQPRPEDLFAYAELLGEQADTLSGRDPLPGVSEIRQALREVDIADQAPRLSDTDLVLLAAAASGNTAATARLELYPRDLAPLRAMRISQVGSLLGRAELSGSGVPDAEYVNRVRSRFPDLMNPPKVENVRELLHALGYEIVRDGSSGHLRARSTMLSSSRSPARPKTTSTTVHREKIEHAHRRLVEASHRGGFVALKSTLTEAAPACAEIARMDGVHPVNVATEFVRLLREVVAEQGRPRWEVVLSADSESASPAAKSGLAALLVKTWDRLEAHVRAAGNGATVLLHDATPLARYGGGNELLARLAVAARDAGESPRGLWLLCPMGNPDKPPSLDGMTVGVDPGDAEQLSVPYGFGTEQHQGGKEQRAS